MICNLNTFIIPATITFFAVADLVDACLIIIMRIMTDTFLFWTEKRNNANHLHVSVYYTLTQVDFVE